MIGYARYLPWWTVLDILGLVALVQAQRRSRWFARLGLCGAGVLWWLRPVVDIPLRLAVAADDRYALEALLENAPPKVVYGYYSGGLFGSIEEIVAIVPLRPPGTAFGLHCATCGYSARWSRAWPTRKSNRWSSWAKRAKPIRLSLATSAACRPKRPSLS